MPRLTRVALVLFLLAGCGGDSGAFGTSPPGNLDPAVPPITSGSWYRPPAQVTWQWQLDGAPNLTYAVELYDLDLFATDSATITALHAANRALICYFSAGSDENWRPDHGHFLATDRGKPVPGWPGEQWLDIRSASVQAVMLARLDTAAAKHCDGVEPDWMHNYQEDTGFPLTASDQLGFNRWLANAAHTRGLAIALKNDINQTDSLVAYVDFALNEQCHEFDECGVYGGFTAAGKPVLNAEYLSRWASSVPARDSLCQAAAVEGLRTLVLPLALNDAFRYACP